MNKFDSRLQFASASYFFDLRLLDVLNEITETPSKKYPSATDFEEEIIKQVTSLKEKRALPKLLEITQFDVSDNQNTVSPLVHNKAVIVGQAIEALLEISAGQYFEQVKKYINIGIMDDYHQENDSLAAIRYHLIRGLQYCPQAETEELLKPGMNDPHSEVKAFAKEIYHSRKNRY